MFICSPAVAQESYEVQVYASPTLPVRTTILELHSNFSPAGPSAAIHFSHPVHETLEITTGITPQFELGFYIFNRIGDGAFNYTGSHIRPRVTIPESWHWSFGASLSVEAGFIKDPVLHTTEWDYEIRPIFDKTFGKHYFSFNPAFDGSFTTHEFSFEPNFKYAWTVKPKYAIGLEYYGSVGDPLHLDPGHLQTHQLYLVTDLFLHPDYECSFGAGFGMTASSDKLNLKLIVGRRINWKKKKNV